MQPWPACPKASLRVKFLTQYCVCVRCAVCCVCVAVCACARVRVYYLRVCACIACGRVCVCVDSSAGITSNLLLLAAEAKGNTVIVTSIFGEMYSIDDGRTFHHSIGGGLYVPVWNLPICFSCLHAKQCGVSSCNLALFVTQVPERTLHRRPGCWRCPSLRCRWADPRRPQPGGPDEQRWHHVQGLCVVGRERSNLTCASNV